MNIQGTEDTTFETIGADNKEVSLSYLSELTGFPIDFIKQELVLDDEVLTLESLRKSMLKFLDETMKEVN